MRLKNSDVKKILLVSLTNIGDVILTLPVADILDEKFPEAGLSILIGPKARTLLEGNPLFHRVHIFDKRAKASEKFALVKEVRAERYDTVVDVRNSWFPVLAGAKQHTPFFEQKKTNGHMKQKHLDRLATLIPFESEPTRRKGVFISAEDTRAVAKMLEGAGYFAVIAPGAAAHEKHWAAAKYAALAEILIEKKGLSVVLVGDQGDGAAAGGVQAACRHPLLNLCGQTTLSQLAAIITRAAVVVTNDSAPMHLASYLNAPVVALFGPSDPLKYGPWSQRSYFFNAMKIVEPGQVFDCIQKMLGHDGPR